MEYVIGGLLIGIVIVLGIIASILIEIRDKIKEPKEFKINLADHTVYKFMRQFPRLLDDGRARLAIESLKTKLNSILSALEDLIKK